jgi:hypothetical protein
MKFATYIAKYAPNIPETTAGLEGGEALKLFIKQKYQTQAA